MAPASGVPANLPMRNSRTDTGEDQVCKSASTGPSAICHVFSYCLYIVLGLSQTDKKKVVEKNADMTAFLEVAIKTGVRVKFLLQHYSDPIIFLINKTEKSQ